MRCVLDACVLYPTVMREMLLGVARAGLFEPLWSDRLLEEWARAAARHGAEQELQARSEIALVHAAFPKACVLPTPALQARLWLPDENDIHVLAAAIVSSADLIVTLNAKDFPRGLLAEEGLARTDPDALLYGFWQDSPDAVESVGHSVLAVARQLFGDDWTMRKLLKKARLPRLAKALSSG